MNRIDLLFTLLLLVSFTSALRADDAFLVKDGEPRAEIIIAENPPRSTRLAAQELQNYVAKITGAKLPIATEPHGNIPVQVYVGQSPHTDRLKVTADGLKDGAYRITAGKNWLVLIGDDTDFEPIEPWARNNSDIVSGKLQDAWDKITGAKWGAPNWGMYKNRIRLPGEIGIPTAQLGADNTPAQKLPPLELWGYDERGSFNAVCGFLRSLGVRWYLPGELGEVVPSLKSIPLPEGDEVVKPDLAMRRFNFRFSVVGPETSMWAMRLGLRDPNNVQVAHGMDAMTQRDETLKNHPEWFALYGGKRHNQPGQRLNQLCYSNEQLFQETVRNVRAQFDHYKYEAVSVMPPDGYTAICQCELCEGKDSPERDNRGLLSDYVWDFVNRVAKEVGKTHPDQKILNCAYGVYTLPPLKIDKLEPNVLVSIVGGRRPVSNRPEQQAVFQKLRADWLEKTDNPIIIFENYPFTDRGWYLPSFTPHSLAASINDIKGKAYGEDIWLSVRQDFNEVGIGFNHFQVYFTARMYWGGKEQNVDAMLAEYCRLFYGPAEKEMLTFFDFCEQHWPEMEKNKENADQALELFAAAQSAVPDDSVYAKRLALIDDFLKGLRNKRVQLAQKRGPVPVLRLVGEPRGTIKIDGHLDDEVWENSFVASTGSMRELQTGRQPIFGTTFKSCWIGNNVYFAIRCDENPGEKLNIATTKKGDQAIWYGDVVEILLDTDAHSYYQIAVNPAGAVVDLDRGAARQAWFTWDSQAEVATHVADDHWTVEIRIPVTEDENDPLHQVIGHKPRVSLPWHINLCRQRIREDGAEYSAFSPTGKEHFHETLKFAHFFNGNSHKFDADPSVTDYLIASRAAEALSRQRKSAEALAAYLELADGMFSPFQKSEALALAAREARLQEDFDTADELAARIPLDSVQKSVRMETMLAKRNAPELITAYGDEDISTWPFWQRGEGYFARGRAYAITRAGKEAESDLTRALQFTSHSNTRRSLLLTLGNLHEQILKDEDAALANYRSIYESVTQIGGADEFAALQGSARILSRRGKFDDALAVLDLAKIDNLRGHWRGSMLIAKVTTLQAAGRKDEAAKICKQMSTDDQIESRHQKEAEEILKSLQEK